MDILLVEDDMTLFKELSEELEAKIKEMSS